MAKTQSDLVDLALGATETTETTIGTMTVPIDARRIVAVYGTACVIPTTGETIAGNFRLSFGMTGGKFKFPAAIHSSPLTAVSPSALHHQFIPVDIPVTPNDTITAYVTLNVAQTGACRGQVGVIYESA